jgi:membrane protein
LLASARGTGYRRWAATSRENQSQEPVAVPRPAVIRSEVVVAPRPSGGTAAGLLGAGAVAGLLGALLIGRRCDCASHCVRILRRQ